MANKQRSISLKETMLLEVDARGLAKRGYIIHGNRNPKDYTQAERAQLKEFVENGRKAAAQFSSGEIIPKSPPPEISNSPKLRPIKGLDVEDKYLDLSVLSIKFSDYASEHSFRQTVKARIANLWSKFLGVNDTDVKKFINEYTNTDSEEFNKHELSKLNNLSIRGLDIKEIFKGKPLTHKLFTILYCLNVDRIVIFHPYFCPQQQFEMNSNHIVAVIYIDTNWNVSHINTLH